MIEEQAVVLSENPKSIFNVSTVRVRVERKSGCQSCQLKSGCGQRVMTEMSSNKSIELDIPNTLDAKPGDRVSIAIPEKGLLNAALVVYLIPLLSMLSFAVAAEIVARSVVGFNDAMVALFGVFGLLLGFIYAKKYGQKHEQDSCFVPEMIGHTPQMSKIIPAHNA